MVLGRKSKHKKELAIRADYIVHIHEIKPWPPSETLTSVQTVFLQWENTSNENSLGTFLAVAGDSNIVFNESFMLPLTLYKKESTHKFRKNYLEFSLVEPRKDKAKGRIIAKASLNLADYGLIEDIMHVNAPLDLKKTYSDALQSYLVITLELVERDAPNSSPSVGFSQDDDSEMASFTDDDTSSHSSRTIGSSMASPSQSDKNGKVGVDSTRRSDAPSDTWDKVKDFVSSSKFSERNMSFIKKNSTSPLFISSPISVSFRDSNTKYNSLAEWQSQGNKAGLKKVKSIPGDNYIGGKPPDLDIPNDSQKKGKLGSSVERKEVKTDVYDGRNEWKVKVEMLEEELREAATIEVALYSVVAEHSSSTNKVHAPARRLLRFYTSACSAGSQAKRASAAKAAVSGLVLVSKACGNDVPRLSFWLSNAIMLRSIITQIVAELPQSVGEQSNISNRASPEPDDLEDALTLLISLERVESWLFCRIIDSVWWQCFTPHMQPSVAKSSYQERSKKKSGRKNGLGSYEQGSFCIELWKKAFKDAYERLCPIRAGGHECGCLSALLLLVMEQLVNRLDVAIFNAILRESGEDMPTDPISDPIGNSKVLPVPPAKSSFTAGAQLKNIIGNWSRWLADLFGLEDGDNEIIGDGTMKAFKAFRLLHALSDLMMLPFGMLVDASTRKEVCPTFGPTIIKRVLSYFVPDEFSPNPIPYYIMDALSAEETSDAGALNSYPCSATTTKYSPPPAALLTCVGEVGRQVLETSRLSTINKTCTSDDELDEVDSPLTRIVPDTHQSSSALAKLSFMPKTKGGRNAVRFQLLREIWRDHQS